MQDSIFGALLPLAVGVVMLGLGLSLTWDDFVRAVQRPRVVLLALVCQFIIVPLIGIALIVAFRPEPALAVGVMLLVATPGGAVANLYSHLAGGDVALNITLTAVTSVLSVVAFPLFANASVAVLIEDGQSVGLQGDKVVQVVGIVLIPVALGMLVRRARPSLADRTERPVKILSMVVLATAVVAALVTEREGLSEAFTGVGHIVTLLLLASLAVGYAAPRLLAVPERQAVAVSLEVGLHNTPLAIAVALSPHLMNDPRMAFAPAVYSLLALPIAGAFSYWMSRRLAEVPEVSTTEIGRA